MISRKLPEEILYLIQEYATDNCKGCQNLIERMDNDGILDMKGFSHVDLRHLKSLYQELGIRWEEKKGINSFPIGCDIEE